MELQRIESWENIPLEVSRLSIHSVIVSVALRRCDPFYPFLPGFVGFCISSFSETSRIVLCWNLRTQSRASLCLGLPRTLNSARPVIAYSAHSVKCETCAPRILQSAKLVGQKFPLTLGSERVVDLESPRTRKSSAISCSTHRRPR